MYTNNVRHLKPKLFPPSKLPEKCLSTFQIDDSKNCSAAQLHNVLNMGDTLNFDDYDPWIFIESIGFEDQSTKNFNQFNFVFSHAFMQNDTSNPNYARQTVAATWKNQLAPWQNDFTEIEIYFNNDMKNDADQIYCFKFKSQDEHHSLGSKCNFDQAT